MAKTILITGSTDGIGLLTAEMLSEAGHEVLLHGRSETKLATAAEKLGGSAQTYAADLSKMSDVTALASAILGDHERLDILINNAGVYKTPEPRTADGMDTRFVVNTIAPYALTRALLPIIPAEGRILNLSSAAQAPVSVAAMEGRTALADMDAYAQSKLGITIWSQALAKELVNGPAVIAVNPGSLLATKMVKEGFGVAGNDLGIGAGILCKLAINAEFANASGKYFDNDAGRFSRPHPAAGDAGQVRDVMQALNALI